MSSVEQDDLESRGPLPGMHARYTSRQNISHCPIKMEQSHYLRKLPIFQKCLGTIGLL